MSSAGSGAIAAMTEPAADFDRVSRLHQQSAPVALGAIADDLGISIGVATLPPRISGKLFRDRATPSGWAITVNAIEPRFRQRFTIAHELGHFVLHRNEAPEGVTDDTFYRSALSDKREAEANAFAANLLMPWHLIDKYVDSGVRTPQELAKLFGVSDVAMNIRLGLPT